MCFTALPDKMLQRTGPRLAVTGWQLKRNPLGGGRMRRAIAVLITLGLAISASGSQPDVLRGRAQVLTWNNNLRVVLFCDSQQRYQLGIFTSVAAAASSEADRGMEADASPLLVEPIGFTAALPSGWQQAPAVAGVLSVGHIAVAERGTCS